MPREKPDLNEPVSSPRLFARGFLVRLAYGLLAIPLILLLQRPGFIGLAIGVSIYLLVCLFGGMIDAVSGRRVEFNLLQKPTRLDMAILILLLVGFLLMRF